MTARNSKTHMFLSNLNTSRTSFLNSLIKKVPEFPSEIVVSLEIISISPLNVSKGGQEGTPT